MFCKASIYLDQLHNKMWNLFKSAPQIDLEDKCWVKNVDGEADC